MTTVIGQATGTIGVTGENDWFKVNVTAGTDYVFSFGNGGLGANGSLTLYDANGNAVSGVGTGSSIVFEPTTAGTYYVGVNGNNGSTGTYTVLQSTFTPDVTNNTSTTGTLSVGGSASGTLSAGGQQDWFKVSLTAGTGYQFNMASGSTAAQVAIYDATGKLIATGDDNDTLNGNSLFYVATSSGTYYVAASDTHGATGAFSVSAATGTFDAAGNTNTAGTIAVGSSVNGTIAYAGQQEWYKITLTAGTEYVFTGTAASGSSLNPSVKIYDANGNQQAFGYTQGGNGSAATSFEATTTGTYYVSAGSVASTTGAFTVSVATATPDVLGTINTTGTVAVGGTATGNLTSPGQHDWYKVTLTAGGHYALTATAGTTGTALSDGVVTLYDSTGKALVVGSGATFYEPTTTGTYYVGVSSLGSNSGTFSVGVTNASVDFLGTTATSGTLAVGGTASGNITNPGQSDWFKATLSAGQQYTLTGSGSLPGTEVTVYDSTGKVVAGGDTTATAFTPATSGTYYIGVSDDTNGTGAFSVALGTGSGTVAGNTGTTGTFTATLAVAPAVSQFNAGTLAANSTLFDTAANVQSGLDTLETMVTAGKVANISLSDSTTPTITVTSSQLTSDAAALKAIGTGYNLSISGFSSVLSQFIQGQSLRYLPGSSHPGSNQAIEISTTSAGAGTIALGNGFNAVVIDGAHSAAASTTPGVDNYTFNVQANGTVDLVDSNTGATQTLTGVTYLVFNDGVKNADSTYQSIYFVGSSINGEVTSLYNAAFLRQPDLAGLEYYVGPISQGSLSMHQTALNFIASPEFQHDYPTASAPSDHGGANDTAFVNTLYNNVLNRTPGSTEVAFYTGELASGVVDRATLLIDFALSPENQQAVSGFLINTTNGAYADASAQLSASIVLGQATAGTTLNPDAISASSIGTGVTVNGITINADNSMILTGTAAAVTVDLTATHSVITVQNSGASIVDGSSFNSTITLTGASNTTLGLGHGGQDTVNLLGGTNTTINNFSAGSGTTLNVTNTTDPTAIQIIDGTAAKVAGSSLAFGTGTSYVVNIGTVTDATAATAAIAANKAYAPADVASEFITFLAKDAAGDTLVWFWGSTGGAANGTIPASSLAPGADTNGNHQVDAAELHLIATIVGVAPSSLTAADLA